MPEHMRTEHPEIYQEQQQLLIDKAKPLVLSILEDCMIQTRLSRVLVLNNGNKEKDLKDKARILTRIEETFKACREKCLELGDLRLGKSNVYNALKEPFDAAVYCLDVFWYLLNEEPSLQEIHRHLNRLHRKYNSMFERYDHEWKSVDFGPDYDHDVGASFDNPYRLK